MSDRWKYLLLAIAVVVWSALIVTVARAGAADRQFNYETDIDRLQSRVRSLEDALEVATATAEAADVRLGAVERKLTYR